jgi:hypothetical protein
VEAVAEIDLVKEEINYLKLWLGIAVVTDISLFSWLFASIGRATIPLVVLALLGAAVIISVIVYLHRRIEARIRDLENL